MTSIATLIAELSLPAYAALSDAEAAALLAEPVEDSAGPLDLDWLDSLLIRADLWPVLEAAAGGSLPESTAGDAERLAARGAARQILATLRSARRHPYLDTGLPEFAIGLDALVTTNVVTAEIASAIRAQARRTRAEALGLAPVDAAAVARARRIGGLR